MIKDFDDIKLTIKELCSIPSVQGEALPGMPFGKEVYRALDYMLKKAESFGFETINYDGYVGEVIWRGEHEKAGIPEKTLGILCHLDVVKAGRLSDWKYPPFTATEENGKIYARGTLDDKGPAVSCLYMMKQLKDEGFKPAKTIKLILGCNEETGWGCMAHYNKVAKMPDFGFSPDGNFPVLYAEKGIMHARFEFLCSDRIKAYGGEMTNMVCDYAYAIAPVDQKLAESLGLKINGEKIESFGVAAHGSTPEKGKNAIEPLLKYLTELNLADKAAYDALFNDVYRLKENSDETGALTMSPNILQAENGKMYITVDFRYPATFAPEFMENAAAKIAPYTIVNKHQSPLFNDKNSFLIKTLLNIFNEETGSHEQPIAIGGGTYARALPEGAAFGPEFIGEDAPIHQPNEYITLKNLEKMSVIYKRAIKELSE